VIVIRENEYEDSIILQHQVNKKNRYFYIKDLSKNPTKR